MCDKKLTVKPSFLDSDDDIRQQPPSQFHKQTNTRSIFCIRVLLKIKKEAFRTPYLERTAETTGVSRTTVARIRCDKSKRGSLSSPTGRRGSRIHTLIPLTRQQSDVTQFYTLWKQLPTLNTLNSTLSFPESVDTPRKPLCKLVYCWKKACDGWKLLVKRQKYCSTANRVLCMPERIRGQVS